MPFLYEEAMKFYCEHSGNLENKAEYFFDHFYSREDCSPDCISNLEEKRQTEGVPSDSLFEQILVLAGYTLPILED